MTAMATVTAMNFFYCSISLFADGDETTVSSPSVMVRRLNLPATAKARRRVPANDPSGHWGLQHGEEIVIGIF
jgi:hypothetical protein